MKKFQTITAAILLNFLAFGLVHAQLGGVAPLPQIKKPEGPTLEATLQWLSLKLIESSAFTLEQDISDSRLDQKNLREYMFDGCNLGVVKTISPKKKQGFYSGVQYEISTLKLSDLDINGFNTWKNPNSRGVLYLKTTGDQRSVRRMSLQQGQRPAGLNAQPELNQEFINKKLQILKTASNQFPESQPSYKNLDDSPGWEEIHRKDDNVVPIETIDVELADRMAAAFKHAILLCQQRVAKEKADQPAKPKEIF